MPYSISPSSSSASVNHQDLYSHDPFVRTRTRDPKYFHEDGSIVFLVEDVLFKFQASLILQPDSISPCDDPDGSTQRYPLGVGNLPKDLTASSEDNPIILPNVQTSQFRNFLFAVMGLPFDPKYRALMVAARDKRQHNQKLLVRYLDISCLARQFGMAELEEWARSQLCLVLESMYSIAFDYWDDAILLRLDSYARGTCDSHCIMLANTFIQYFISVSVDHRNSSQSFQQLNLDTCVRLYKNLFLPHKNPALFGCVFAAILSLGRHSDVWRQGLTSADRVILYAAQVLLTPVSKELDSVNWLQARVDSPLVTKDTCSECWLRVRNLWEESFGKCAGLKSEVPLQDVTELARLPQYRRKFAAKSRWEAKEDIDPSLLTFRAIVFAYSGVKASPPHGSKCPQRRVATAHVDRCIQIVYQGLARRHREFASEAYATT